MTIAILVALCAAAAAQDPAPLLPALQPGDILLCEGFPKRTVTGTDVTMYQLARLGYSSVTVYQRDAGLKVDGIIGPQTHATVEEAFNRAFGPLAPTQVSAPLSLTAEVITNAAMSSLLLTISNQLSTPIRIVGVLATDRDDRLTLSVPSLSVRERYCRHDPTTRLVACGGGSHKAPLCSANTEIRSGESLHCSTTVSRLHPNEDGSVSVDVKYLTADGTSFAMSVQCKRPR